NSSRKYHNDHLRGFYPMSEMMKQEERRSGGGSSRSSNSSYATIRNKQQQIEYPCGCRYLFNHQIKFIFVQNMKEN
ncbi:MAG: hypothetical protein ACJ71G_15885, partial [Nitrososphaeraceae archaeon]